MSVPQFGQSDPGLTYADRPAAFGIAEQAGKIATVRVEKPGLASWHDLPGGAIDPGEDHFQAVVREYGEETGLVVTAGEVFARADQRFINTDGKAYNNRAAFMMLTVTGEEAALKIEDDHTLVWMEPFAALKTLRHEAHAWAVTAWLRAKAQS